MVSFYSKTNLTKEENKLVAISALTREMKPSMPCRYLAVHWETEIVWQFEWQGDCVRSRPSIYRGQSW